MMRTPIRTLARSLAMALLSLMPLLGTSAQAQSFPSRAIKFVVPFGPGSGTDITARYYAKHFQDLTGQPVIVENRPGGNGFVAVRQVLSAPADGHTIFIGSNSTLAVNTAVLKDLPYDPVSDFAPLSLLMRSPALALVPSSSEHNTLQDFISSARANPGKLNYGSGSAGYQLMAELFNQTADVSTFHVPFNGGNETLTAVASNVVELSFVEITSAQALIKGEKIRALAIAAETRSPTLPEVPTAIEAGLPNFTAYTWVAAMAPVETPKEIQNQLAQHFSTIANMQETQDFYANQGAEVGQAGAENLREFQRKDIELWKRVATQAGIEPK